uniref:PE-PGRS family protein n=1 Tax=Parastrongyloides trichosuri TaxID=131310 RepID=A0A0N4ZIZ6_PARTI
MVAGADGDAAHGVQRRFDAGEVGLVAADHEGQGAGVRGGGAARDGGPLPSRFASHLFDSFGSGGFSEPQHELAGVAANGRVIDIGRARVVGALQHIARAVQHEARRPDLALDLVDVDAVQGVGRRQARTGRRVVVDDDIEAARLQRPIGRRIDLGRRVRREILQVQVVVVLGGEDQVQTFGPFRRADGRTDGVGVVERGGGGQGLAIAGLKADELGRLPGGDVAVGSDSGREQAGEVAAAHDHVADLLTLRHLGEGQGFGGVAGLVAGHVRRRADGAGQRRRIGVRGGLGRGLGRDDRGGRRQRGGDDEGEEGTHGYSSCMFSASSARLLEAIDELVSLAANGLVEDVQAVIVGGVGDGGGFTVEDEAGGLDLAAQLGALDAVQGLDGGVGGAGRGLMVDDHEQAAGLQRLEDVGVHLGHIDAETGDVEVVVLLAHEDHVQRLIKAHGVQVAVDAADVGISGDQGVGARVFTLGGLVGHEGVDVAALAHHPREQAGEVARAGADVGDALAGLKLGEGEDFGRVTQGIAGDLVGGTQGAGLHGDGGQLDHLRAFRADDMDADHALAVGVDHQLHQHPLVRAGEGVLHRAEAGHIDIDAVRAGAARLMLGQADDADRRLAEDGGGDGFVVEVLRVVLVDRLVEGDGLADGDRGQVHAVSDVADGPDVVGRGLRVRIDGDGALVVQLHAGVLQPQCLDVGDAAGGEHDDVMLHRHAVAEVADQTRLGLLDRGVLAAQDDLDAALLDLARQMGAHVVVKAAQDVGAAIDQGRLDAQTGEDARELDRDIAAARDHDALGQLRQMESFFGRDGMFDAGQVLGLPRAAAGGDQDLLGGEGLVFADDFDGVGVLQDSAAVDQIDARLGQVGGVDARQAGDLDVLGLQEGRPVEFRIVEGPAVALGDLQRVADFRGHDHELLGHAAADDAGAADPVFLGHSHLLAAQGGQARRADPAGTGADDEEVVVVLGH